MNQQTTLIARLLATENIIVSHGAVRTASFNIETRELVLPTWNNMTPEIVTLLVGHEVGHALYTDSSYSAYLEKDIKLSSYMNILEDVRIEKLIKRKYPGIRKDMLAGYSQLIERDFFGLSKIKDLSKLILIDRINLYFKAGVACGVKFTPQEYNFISRAETTETLEEVYNLAVDVYEFSKKPPAKQPEVKQPTLDIPDEEAIEGTSDVEQNNPVPSDKLEETVEENTPSESSESTEDDPVPSNSSDETADETVEENIPSELPTEQSSDDSGEEIDEELLQPTTNSNLSTNLERSANLVSTHSYYELDEPREDLIIGYKQILSETIPYYSPDEAEYTVRKELYSNFRQSSTIAVRHMVKEFEMRKSADILARTTIAKSGGLDTKRIVNYKLTQDIFKRNAVVPTGKSHGMLFLLDWSGSMASNMHDTLEQLLNLTMFCNMVKIPYKVYAFTSAYSEVSKMNSFCGYVQRNGRAYLSGYPQNFAQGNKLSNKDCSYGFSILELFSSEMTAAEYNSMSYRLHEGKFTKNIGYSLSQTPLNAALAWLYLKMPTLTSKWNVSKISLVTLSDGESGALLPLSGVRPTGFCYIHDKTTNKNIPFSIQRAMQTSILIEMIKQKYNCSTVGFYLVERSSSVIRRAVNAILPKLEAHKHQPVTQEWNTLLKAQSYVNIKNSAYDSMFLIDSNTKIDSDSLDEVSSKLSTSAIAKKFGKVLSTNKNSRLLLTKFIETIA